MKVLDIDHAVRVSGHSLNVWSDVRKHPDSQPYSGGVFDSWPAWAVDALAICRDEEFEIHRFQQHQEHAHG